MPFTDTQCPECGKNLHTDELFDGECIMGWGTELPVEVSW